MNLFEQLSAATAAAKALKQPDARFFACNNNGIVYAYYPNDLYAIVSFTGSRVYGTSKKRYVSLNTPYAGLKIEVPIVRPVPLEHTCPAECYRIHLTTPDPEGEAI